MRALVSAYQSPARVGVHLASIGQKVPWSTQPFSFVVHHRHKGPTQHCLQCTLCFSYLANGTFDQYRPNHIPRPGSSTRAQSGDQANLTDLRSLSNTRSRVPLSVKCQVLLQRLNILPHPPLCLFVPLGYALPVTGAVTHQLAAKRWHLQKSCTSFIDGLQC